MSQSRVELVELGRRFTVTGDLAPRALAYFSALSALRMILGCVVIACGAGGLAARLFF